MNYMYSVLTKVAVSLLLVVTTFELWKSTNYNLLHWLLPLTALIWIVFTGIEGVKVKKNGKWTEEKEEMDERAQSQIYKAGFYAFFILIGAMFIFFYAYSVLGITFLNPLNTLAILGLLGTVVYFGTRTYLLFFD